jgi:exopolysaccharide production protein ExoQ
MIGGAARAAFLVLLPALGVGGALGVPVLICLAGALSLRPSLLRQVVEKRPPVVLLLSAVMALAVLSSAWSADPAAPVQALKVGVLVLLGLTFAAAAVASPRMTQAGGVAACAVLAILLAIEALWGLPLNRAAQPEVDPGELLRNVSRGASLLMALTWGAAAALIAHGGRTWIRLGLLVLAAGGFIAFQFGQFANTLAFAAGLLVFAAAFVAPRPVLGLTLAGLTLWLIAAPFLTPLLLSGLTIELPYSWNARVEIWSYVIERIWERPWIGHGLDAARMHHPPVPVHPHSVSLQIWFELGVVGVALTAALMIAGARQLLRAVGHNRAAAAAACGTLVSLGLIANLSFNLWAEWWLAAMFIAAALVGSLARRTE